MGRYRQHAICKGTFTVPSDYEPKKTYIRDDVAPVLYQGNCSICTYLAVHGAIEISNINNINGGNMSLSAQEILECGRGNRSKNVCKDFENPNILLGNLINKKIILHRDSDYPPFDLSDISETCRATEELKDDGVATEECIHVNNATERQMMYLIETYGHLIAAVNVKGWLCESMSVISSDSGCGNTPMEANHAVLLTGYNNSDGRPYFLVRNWWGAECGEKSYHKVAMNNTCGIQNRITVVTKTKCFGNACPQSPRSKSTNINSTPTRTISFLFLSLFLSRFM